MKIWQHVHVFFGFAHSYVYAGSTNKQTYVNGWIRSNIKLESKSKATKSEIFESQVKNKMYFDFLITQQTHSISIFQGVKKLEKLKHTYVRT